MNHPMALRELVKNCTVRLLVQGIGKGTGFCVAPGLVLTCAHVIAEALEQRLPVKVHTWDGQQVGQTFVDAKDVLLEEIPVPDGAKRVHKYPDLALLRIERRDLPCVYLAEIVGGQDLLFSYGYVQDYPGGEEAQFTYEGEGWIDNQRPLLKFSQGQVTHGLSGAPLLNLRTGGVCGIVQRTRGAQSDLGGRAIPMQTVLACFPELSALQQQFHQSDQRWFTSLAPSQRQALHQPSTHIQNPFVQQKPQPVTDPIIMDIARSLQRRKGLRALTVLFLGARTGGLYGNHAFYTEMSTDDAHLDTLSAPEKFRACYRLLQRSNQDTIHDILHLSLRDAPQRVADQQIAELVRRGYFDVVVSTHIDVLLDRAIERERLLAPPFDARLVVYDGRNADVVIREERQRSKVIKIFGNLEAGLGDYYTVGHELELDTDENRRLKDYLQKILVESIFVIGYDPVWDRPLERVFLERKGGNIFYINEDLPEEQTTIAHAIKKRQGICLTGEQGDYTLFTEQLFRLLSDNDKS